MSNDDKSLKDLIRERMAQLPAVVRDAIASSEVEKRLRELATTYKLHFDQWDELEYEVTLTLLGIQPIEDLERNIQTEVGVLPEVARELATAISKAIFEPIRLELERQLEHPAAKEATVSETDAMRTQILASTGEVPSQPTATPAASVVQPATPPTPVPDIKVTRPSESTEYKPNQASHERKNVVDDPYREPVL